MAGRRSILIFWALLMVPALILAGIAFRLLSLEEARIRQARITTLVDQARTAAGHIDLTIETVQNNLTGALLEIPAHALEQRLLEWERQNPLVRNVFILHPKKGLEYPLRSLAATREERQFINRFAPLFSGEMAFDFNRAAMEESPVPASRTGLYALSREPSPAPHASGWIPWFSDNRLYILGWVQRLENGPVYGVELEMMTLLSRLASEFPAPGQKGAALVLSDGSGSTLLRSGEAAAEGEPDGRLAVSLRLPHWSLSVYRGNAAHGSTRGFMVLALLLLGLMLTAIVSGGIMITRLTLAKIKDARHKTSFVASVSHELKTPLTSIRMYAELLQSGRIKDVSKQARYLEVIVGESGRLTRLINNLLDFGRLEQGRKTYNPVPFDMKDFLEGLIGIHAIRLRNAGFEIIKDFAPGPFPVVTDRDALEQSVLNLMDNTLKYADQGKFITFILAREAGDTLVKVRDGGPGIPAPAADRVFEKFYRADNSLTAAKPGSGLGLSIARQMLRDQGGDLYLDPDCAPHQEAEMSRGACFTIRIPHNEKD
ncbi:MAG: HAMP domain-containing histidine kinase [Desulfobacter sp.]|nr:MAG: HAMP domain-containing histidine kinase [Desulfobacter sp.]